MWFAAILSLLVQAAPVEPPVQSLDQTLRFALGETGLDIQPVRPEPLDRMIRLTGTSSITRLRQQETESGWQVHLQATVENPLIGALQIAHVFGNPVASQLALDAESPVARTSIQLIINLPAAIDPESNPVILHGLREIFDPQTDPDAPTESDRIRLEGASVVRLMRDQGEDFERWMRPVAEALGKPWLFSVLDLDAARQVLLAATPVPEGLSQAVMVEVARLDAVEFSQREDAVRRLRSMGLAAVVVLSELDPGTLSIEQASAVETLLLQAMPLTDDEASRRRRDLTYLIDLMYAPEASIREAAGKAVEAMLGRATGVDASAEPDRAAIEPLRAARP
jgi:hypothetical protein